MMTNKEKFYLLENKVIYKTKEYKKECKFINLKTNEKIEYQQLVSDIENALERSEKLENVVEIIKNNKVFNHELMMLINDYINEEEEFTLLKEVFRCN